MKIIELARCEQGFMLQLLGLFRIGTGSDMDPEDGLGPCTFLILGIWKFQVALSLEWRNNVDIKENIW